MTNMPCARAFFTTAFIGPASSTTRRAADLHQWSSHISQMMTAVRLGSQTAFFSTNASETLATFPSPVRERRVNSSGADAAPELEAGSSSEEIVSAIRSNAERTGFMDSTFKPPAKDGKEKSGALAKSQSGILNPRAEGSPWLPFASKQSTAARRRPVATTSSHQQGQCSESEHRPGTRLGDRANRDRVDRNDATDVSEPQRSRSSIIRSEHKRMLLPTHRKPVSCGRGSLVIR